MTSEEQNDLLVGLEQAQPSFQISGSGTSGFQTAGMAAQFTITVHDTSGARATTGGMDFIVQLNGPTSVRGSVLDQLDGSYTAHYTVTRAGDYELIVNNVQQGGLTVEYYENIWLFHREHHTPRR